ncbi:MAG TPA: Rrf2 family transcriptional regulator [Ignavibacteriaceae bacterium]|nr:Rrf2 family transcriptional regulator [Ignavibacteriaceae bacterium]
MIESLTTLIFVNLFVTLTVTNKEIMSASTKLSAAVKALAFLAKDYPSAKNSVEISMFTGLNASKLRKLLSMLTKNGIVESAYGTNGGFKLRRKPAEIHLQEIYCAIEDRKAFHLDVSKSNGGSSPESAKLNVYFLDLFSTIQIDIEERMKNISLQSVIDKIKFK